MLTWIALGLIGLALVFSFVSQLLFNIIGMPEFLDDPFGRTLASLGGLASTWIFAGIGLGIAAMAMARIHKNEMAR